MEWEAYQSLKKQRRNRQVCLTVFLWSRSNNVVFPEKHRGVLLFSQISQCRKMNGLQSDSKDKKILENSYAHGILLTNKYFEEDCP